MAVHGDAIECDICTNRTITFALPSIPPEKRAAEVRRLARQSGAFVRAGDQDLCGSCAAGGLQPLSD